MIPKFREWDQERQRIYGKGMSYSVREEFDDSVNFRFDHEEDLDYTTRLSETDRNGTPYRNLMMSTGLKDKNGVEIFEGDIVKVSNHPFQKKEDSAGIEIDGNYLINWSEHSLTWLAGDLLLYQLKPYIEVIGNRFENPELLEVIE
ncbi:YopX family protein [Enterococcus avium]|uniref:YopX family protein n=1 Tax=Enterococcus avium TaxID=33945 RepID=UPI0032E36D54